jgi:hypothetical protein
MPLTVAAIVKFSIVIRIGRADRSGWPSRQQRDLSRAD